MASQRLTVARVASLSAVCLLIAHTTVRATGAFAQPGTNTERENPTLTVVRDLFRTAWEAKATPPADRARVAVVLYRDVWPRLWAIPLAGGSSLRLPDDAKVDDILSGRYGRANADALRSVANEICLDFFLEQWKAILPVMVTEIRESQGTSCNAVTVLSDMSRHVYIRGGVPHKDGSISLDEKVGPVWSSFVGALYPVITKRFLEGGDDDRAYVFVQGLDALDDPRAIPILLGDDAEARIIRYFPSIRNLQRNRTAKPEVLRLLGSENSEVRWRAAYALDESGDPALLEPVLKLLQDRDARVREQALWMASHLPQEAKDRSRTARQALLDDQDLKVRIACVTCFAYDRDAVCAPALLGLLRDETLDSLTHGRVVSAMESLAGQSFGYRTGSDAWHPSTEENRAALVKFEEWMQEHPPASPQEAAASATADKQR